MRRWNGWGQDTTDYPLPEPAAEYLADLIGSGSTTPDATREQVLGNVPASRMTADPLLSLEPADRLRHACGHSLPDWVAIRSGTLRTFPDAVIYAGSEDDVRSAFSLCRQTGAALIPYGGGTSVVGHINPLPDGRPTVTLDLSRLRQMRTLDDSNHVAVFDAGVCGPDLEAQLAARGYTLGHFPQSFEFSTLGGWVATRSCGQQSYYYGRIEDLFCGGHVETPAGVIDLPDLPASAAGPDLRQLLLGSEGRMGVITQAHVRVRRLPETDAFYGVFFPDWAAGAAAVQEMAQGGLPVSMMRLSDAQETETTLALAGKPDLTRWADRGLRLAGYGATRSLLILGITGEQRRARQALGHARNICRKHGGLFPIGMIGHMWQKSRFLTPYLRNTLWERGYALDTVETALPWAGALDAAGTIQQTLRDAFAAQNIRLLVFTHLSHIYADGASAYTTYIFPRAKESEATVAAWRAAKAAVSRTIVGLGGTISHQHGVGLDHAPFLEAEKGLAGIAALHAAFRTFDPEGMLNPGKLIAA
ncbi:MAG: FAD-binding oxidoreductase [Chloroflexi bacterium]|nr:FAD-binding oxidoreductase [Chloroflexota bacterium]